MSTLPDHLEKRLAWLEQKAGALDARIDKVVGVSVQAVDRLDKHIAFLEERLELAHTRLNKLQHKSCKWADTLANNGFAVDEQLQLIVERLEALESKVLPSVGRDTDKINDIIGRRPTLKFNPLDKKD